MRSTGHRRNILGRRYREIGIGIAMGAPQDTLGTARRDAHDRLRPPQMIAAPWQAD
jgi:hypothetical protein